MISRLQRISFNSRSFPHCRQLWRQRESRPTAIYYKLLKIPLQYQSFPNGLVIEQIQTLFQRLFSTQVKDWHHEDFLSGCSLEEKERWLETTFLNNNDSLDLEAYLVVLKELAKSKKGGAPRRAEFWMSRIEADQSVELSPFCFQLVIECWANAEGEDPSVAVARGENWLRKFATSDMLLKDEFNNGVTECYNAFLDCCSRGRAAKKSGQQIVLDHARRAEDTLNELIQRHKDGVYPVSASVESFNFVLRAITRCRNDINAADSAHRVFHQLDSFTNIKPNVKSYVMLLDALAITAKLKARRTQYNEERSDSRKNGLDEIAQMESLIAQMDSSLVCTESYNVLLSTWANIAGTQSHQNSPFKAEELLHRMIDSRDEGLCDVSPDTISYLQVIRAWANSGTKHAGTKASWWLRKQWEDCQGGESLSLDLLPNVKSYTAAVMAWRSVCEPMQAEALLFEMLEKKHTVPNGRLDIDTEIVSSVLRSWLALVEKSEDSAVRIQSLRKSIEWLDFLIKEESRSDGAMVHTTHELFIGILKTARKTALKSPETLDLATHVFRELKNSRHKLDHSAYASLLQVGILAMSGEQHDQSRRAFIRDIVESCAQDGLISRKVVGVVVDGPVFSNGWTLYESSRMSAELFREWPLPPSWTRNIKQNSLLPRCDDIQRKAI